MTRVLVAGLLETLKGPGPLAVFGPTDAAFEAIPRDQLNVLLQVKPALTKVATYHVMAGSVMAEDVVDLRAADRARPRARAKLDDPPIITIKRPVACPAYPRRT
ncbi:fasciclin domain-containing protein [Alkalilimnicola sp. S0819]|uniref:fasciclin domain-containing protein n=1 Tax=Alkalilimnicola sp. S0819 TaxID=2613922 RepID=UPI001D008A81|nr:fasciclin domain-containing protein [Alkalilimnicola sp. S0819]